MNYELVMPSGKWSMVNVQMGKCANMQMVNGQWSMVKFISLLSRHQAIA